MHIDISNSSLQDISSLLQDMSTFSDLCNWPIHFYSLSLAHFFIWLPSLATETDIICTLWSPEDFKSDHDAEEILQYMGKLLLVPNDPQLDHSEHSADLLALQKL